MHQKMKNWSESRGRSDDIMHGIGASDDDVGSMAVRRGVVLLSDCQSCGAQHKSVITWGEVAAFFMQEPVKDTAMTRQGILMSVGCRCGKTFPMMVDWDEVRQWVDMGVRSGSISPKILQVRRR